MDTRSIPEQIVVIPWEDLHDSPKQYRRRYPEAYIAELTANIKAVGRISSPLLARPIVPPLFAGDASAVAGYEVISGHCRKRAGMAAGLPGGPCIVRSMTDAEAALIMISENLQRKDVHAIEEAEGFADMMKEHGKTADDLAAEFGKSRSYIYGRLKLLQAVPQVRDATLDGNIGTEVALLIARLRQPKLQERALKAIEAKYMKMDDGGKKSYRDIKRLLAEMFTLDLKDAIFDPEDASLVVSAGVCSACEKLSGNAPEYADLTEKHPGHYPGHIVAGNANLCTDPTCWDTKHKAHLVRDAERMRAEGKVVVDGNKARAALGADGKTVKGAYLSLADVKAALKASGKKSSDLPLVNIQDQRTGKTVQAVAAAELKAIGVAKPEAPKPSRGYRELTPAEREQQAKEQAELAQRHDRLLQTCVAKLREAPRTSLDLDLVVGWALEQVDYWNTEGKWLAQRYGVEHMRDLAALVPSMSADEKGVLLMTVVMAHDEGYWLSGLNEALPERIGKVATAYGIDVDLAMAVPMPDEILEVAPTPSTAARADEGADDEVEESVGEPAPIAAAPAKGKNAARYRNSQTGETWSGRGLMPKWLRVAINNGASLGDFDTASTPSKAAQAPDGEKAGSAEQQSLLADLVDQDVEDQAGFAGRADEGAGDAGASDAAVEAAEPAEA